MKMVKQSFEILAAPGFPLKLIEQAGRTCYKSEEKITATSSQAFTKMLLVRGHESVLEHVNVTVKFITDRGISHELVRHRLASYSQESTRYVNYSGKDIYFICPDWLEGSCIHVLDLFEAACKNAEDVYKAMIRKGCSPQEARSVLPTALKTEVVMTANLREWRHVFKLRTAKAAHPQMRELMIPCLNAFKKMIPELFDDILPEKEEEEKVA